MQFPKARHRLGTWQFLFFRMVHWWLSFIRQSVTTRKSLTHATRFISSRAAKAFSLMERGAMPWTRVHSCLSPLVTSTGLRIFHPTSWSGSLFMDRKEAREWQNVDKGPEFKAILPPITTS